ncbi:ATP-dependent helicase HrpB [Paenibacillus sp. NFR01]|uniref:ATP-dependent helicase HrpB n=1 Tax=Paenibacillus sp. NFR01 TaxID=1566279 RepID=UPI0008CE4D2C|nr:ATP-dependent helicase HrpB [Paenibacillus sp. NFR01]SET16957.1 ATP-dependent helicase HrpB [Paenibacillus sp. NFR01]
MTLPIQQIIPELQTALRSNRAAVLIAEPGAGKTTGVPPALLDEPWLAGQTILMLEPRRLAARSAAVYMARAKGEQAGQTVGYRMRNETKVSKDTRITVVTEGVLTRMLQQDPSLEGVGLVIFDEFHERSLHADLGLALALEAQAVLRDDLRILVMSATLDGQRVGALLGGAPVLESPGRTFPVETVYLPRGPLQTELPLEQRAAAAVRRALAEQPGDVLVFLPGEREIRRTERELAGGSLPAGTVLRPLYGQLPQDQQDAAVAPSVKGERKVVLATSIAETSLTIEGVRTVIDTGLRRTQVFSPRTGMPRLTTVPVSKASADQRRGRAGRTAPGVCYRLWSREEHDRLPDDQVPEMLEADLAPLALELALWGARPDALQWLDAPPAAAYAQGAALLRELGALDAGGAITAHGRRMALLGAHPRTAHMLLRAAELDAAPLACRLAALLQERDLLRGPAAGGDLALRAEALLRYERSADTGGADPAGLRAVLREARTLEAQLRLAAAPVPGDAERTGLLLSFAYPDRIGQTRGGGAFLLSGGRGAALREGDLLARAAYIVAAAVDDQAGQSRILLAAELSEADLLLHHKDRIAEQREVYWDDASGSVKARRRTLLGALVLKESADARPTPEETAAALLAAVRAQGLQVLPWDKATLQLRERLAFMHGQRADWPDVCDAALLGMLEDWLAPYVHGMRSLKDLQRIPLARALEGLLDWNSRQTLEREAPTHIAVPSGSRVAIDYSNPEMPVLAVRLQEMFGLEETPRIGKGRVPLLLHLLSPARRPVQVTSDLASFWSGAYFEVKKDLKGRYPKHYWPEDPRQAVPTSRVRPPQK